MTENLAERKRYYLLDSVRGLCILGMILYHTLFDVVMMFGLDYESQLMQAVNVVRDFGACCFIFLSGMCFHFGKHHLRRSLLISACGLLVTGVTYIVMPETPILFGILTFMGTAGLLMIPLSKVFSKIPPVMGAAVSFFAFLLFFGVNYAYIGYYDIVICTLPHTLYLNLFTAFLGFPYEGFASSDYYALLPWIFMYFCGYFSWKLFSKSEKILKFLDFRIPFLEKTGKWSLWIYIGHQPVVLGIVMLAYILINKFS